MAEDRVHRRPVAEAKARFAECVREAEDGLETLLTRHGRPVARIVPCVDPPVAGDVREPATSSSFSAPSFRSAEARRRALRELLEQEIWPRVPEEQRGAAPTKKEREQILGYGEPGV